MKETTAYITANLRSIDGNRSYTSGGNLPATGLRPAGLTCLLPIMLKRNPPAPKLARTPPVTRPLWFGSHFQPAAIGDVYARPAPVPKRKE
jgi:hypothetical protein